MEQLFTDLFDDQMGPEITLEDGKLIRPFEYATDFLPVNFADPFTNNRDIYVLCSRFRYKGLRGVFTAHTQFWPTDVPENIPMGTPDCGFEWRDGLRIPTNPPLTLSMLFSLESAQDVQTLRRHCYQFILGSSTYFIAEDPNPTTLPTIAISSYMINTEGELVTPILPYSLSALRDIRASAVDIGQPSEFRLNQTGRFNYEIVPAN